MTLSFAQVTTFLVLAVHRAREQIEFLAAVATWLACFRAGQVGDRSVLLQVAFLALEADISDLHKQKTCCTGSEHNAGDKLRKTV